MGEVSDVLLGDKVDVIVQDAKKLLKSHRPSNLEVDVCVLDVRPVFLLLDQCLIRVAKRTI